MQMGLKTSKDVLILGSILILLIKKMLMDITDIFGGRVRDVQHLKHQVAVYLYARDFMKISKNFNSK